MEFLIEVQFKDKAFKYTINESTTLRNLRDLIFQDTNVPSGNQKLLGHNNILQTLASSEPIIASLQNGSGSNAPGSVTPATHKHLKLVLVGQTEEEKARFENSLSAGQEFNKRNLHIKDDLDLDNYKQKRRHGAYNKEPRQRKQLPQYRFENIKVLQNPEFSRESKSRARRILKKLSRDPGVLQVMQKHRWKVPLLSEMYPEGKVGISEVCVLGLNVGNGQEIKLRLRTDDLKGFRKWGTIKEVLCHELAHNRFSEHNGDFFMFMREIQKDVEQLNWKKGKSAVIGGEERYRSDSDAANYSGYSDISDSEYEDKDGKYNWSTSHGIKVGNNTETSELFEGLDLKDKVRLAALTRLQKTSDDEANNKQGDLKTKVNVGNQNSNNINIDLQNKSEPSIDLKENMEMDSNEKLKNEDKEDLANIPTVLEVASDSNFDIVSIPEDVRNEILRNLELVTSRNNVDRAVAALELILKYCSNILQNPSEEKYRRINRTSKAYQNSINNVLSANALMLSIRFALNPVDASVLVFPNEADIIILKFAKREIQSCLTLLKCLV